MTVIYYVTVQDFYQKYYLGLRTYIKRKINDDDTVEELVNDVLMAAYNALPNFNGKCSEFSFVCSIANKKVIDFYRKKKIKTVLFSANPVFEEIADKAINPERDALKNELKEEIKATWQEISEGSRKLLRLKYISDWKIDKIAKLMGMSIKAVESRLFRARKEFQKEYLNAKKKAYKYSETDGTDRG